MKITKIIGLLLFVSILTFSCSKDDLGIELTAADKEIQKQEQTPIDISTVGLIIENVQIKTAPLTPNEAISMTVPSTDELALEDGFKIKLDSNDDFDGVYVQLVNTDGTIAGGYYDIPFSSLEFKKKTKNTAAKGKKKTLFSKSLEDEDFFEIPVNFGDNITPGTFCYSICIYDDQGNISAPQEVCVTVKAFGGATSLVGEWNFTKLVTDDTTYYPNELWCFSSKESCNGKVIELKDCNNGPEEFTLDLMSDGTYQLIEIHSDIEAYYETLDQDCNKQKESYGRSDIAKYEENGKWAYDIDTKSLILIQYSSVELYEDGEEYTNTYTGGDLNIDTNTTTVLRNSLTVSFDDRGDEQNAKFYFSK